MGKTVFHGNIKINTTIPSGTGDNVLTADATTGDLGQIGTIDTSTFIPKTLTDGYVLVGNASNVATGVAVTGDVTISNAGVTAIGSGVIVNADVNASAAIALTKLAATTASRALVSDGSGFITPSATTSTEIGYVSGVTSAIQTQIDSKISTSILTTNGDLLYRDGTGAVTRLPVGTNGYVLAVTGGLPVWEPKTPVPNGGTTGQYLAKQSATDGDVDWETLVVANITDLTATAAELNIMDGVTVTFTEINYLSGVSSNVQTQLNAKQATVTGAATTIVSSNLTASRAVIANASGKVDVSTVTSTELGYLSGVTSPLQSQLNAKLSTALAQHAILVGNASNIASTLVVGSEGQVLTVSGGTPTWVTPGSGGTVTSVDVSGGTTGLTFSGGPVTTTGTITMTGTLDETHGGTGQATFTTGDILYASASNTLSKLAVGSDGQVLTLAAGVPSWAAPTGVSGLTTNRIPYATSATSLGDDSALTWDSTNNIITVGTARLFTISKANDDLFLGELAGNTTTTGTGGNIGIGERALEALTSGNSNIAIGALAGDSITTGTSNTLVGTTTGTAITTGSSNIILGQNNAAALTTGSGNILIGNALNVAAAGTANYLSIQNIIFGTSNSATGTAVSTGSIGIGESSPDRRLHVTQTDAGTNTVLYPLRLTRESSSTPAAGIGAGIEFEVETASTNNEVGATIEVVATDVTGTSEDFDVRIQTMSAGSLATVLVVNNSGIKFATNSILRAADDTDLQLIAGTATADGLNVVLAASGASGTGDGGYVALTAGDGSGGGANGNIYLSTKNTIILGPADLGTNNVIIKGNDGATAVSSFAGSTVTFIAGSAGGNNENGGHLYFNSGSKHGTGLDGNIGVFTTSVANWQAMERGIFIANATTVPTGNPTGGGFLYVEGGALKWRGSGGTTTTIGPA